MILHKNKYFKIKLHQGYYTFEPNFREVIILPIVDNKYFLLIKAKRKLLKYYNYEFPAGSFSSKKETSLKAAKRELEEETGIVLKKFNKFYKLKSILQIPNRSKLPIFSYYVNLKRDQIKNSKFQNNEVRGIQLVTLKKLFDLIIKGKFYSSVPLAQLLQFLIIKKIFKI